MLRLLLALLLITPAMASAAQVQELEFQLYFKAFCKNDANEVEVAEKDEAIVYPLEFNKDGSTKFTQTHMFHLLKSAGYEVYVTLEILREAGAKDFHIRLTPWRKMTDERDISFGTAFVEQSHPFPIPRLGLAVSETINEATGSYCTLTATIASR